MMTGVTRRFPLYFILGLSICLQPAVAAGPATAAFQKLQALAGDWEGTDEQEHPVRANFKLIAGGTAVMETLNMSGMEEMVTLYSVDGDGIALLHYCPTNNQPHMRAIPPSGNIQELVFEFQGAGNLPDLATGHEHKLAMQFQDNDHLTERWTWRKNGKDTEIVYRFTRKAGT